MPSVTVTPQEAGCIVAALDTQIGVLEGAAKLAQATHHDSSRYQAGIRYLARLRRKFLPSGLYADNENVSKAIANVQQSQAFRKVISNASGEI